MDLKALHRIPLFAALYFLLFGALGAEVPFLPRVLAAAGLSAGQIGLVLAAGTVTQVFVGPVFGHVADRLGARLILFVAAIASATSLLLFLTIPGGLWSALAVYVSFAIATAPLNPLADALTVPACAQAGIPYGRVRGIGSAGFFVGILLSSAIAARLGTASIVWTAALLFALLAATLPALPSGEEQTMQTAAGDGIRTLLRIAPFRRVLLVAAMVIGSHAMSDAFAVIHWQASGIGSETIGIMLAVAVASELVFFAILGPMLLGRLGPSVCAAIGAVVGGVRWAVLAETHSVWPVLATQALHGLTFSLVHLACMQVLASAVPRPFFATAQSLYGICANAIASAIITLAAGILFGALHAHAFWLAATLSILALPIALKLKVDGVSPASHRPSRDGHAVRAEPGTSA